jgi:solute carrier family 25 S-adenosylmethionine transporter 26
LNVVSASDFGFMSSEARHALLAGAASGLVVDAALFPLDTLKTRSQLAKRTSTTRAALYRGFWSAVAGSAPSAALFFVSYDVCRRQCSSLQLNPMLSSGVAAVAGEAASCLVRVPVDNVKIKLQAGVFSSTRAAVSRVVADKGLYVGYMGTLVREIPFAAVQLPLFEWLKGTMARRVLGTEDTSRLRYPHFAACGAVAGGVAAALTTPVDVVRTRMMARGSSDWSTTLVEVRGLRAAGPEAFFAGVVPRTLWMSLGGAIFLGVYETTRKALADTHTDSFS